MARIVLIDDEEPIRKVVNSMLKADGHEVRMAENGNEGIELVCEWIPDLVITDMIMPGKEGIETVMELRQKLGERCPKILAVSGGGRTKNLDILEIARQTGADEVLAKPFRRDDLKKVISKVIGA